jgi:hypothetical protein
MDTTGGRRAIGKVVLDIKGGSRVRLTKRGGP